jgi:hypothetical protein
MTVELRYAGWDEYPQISKFLDEHWATDHVYVRMPQLFTWTFGRSSLWDQEGYSFALAEDQGEIVGILGGIPFDFNHFGHVTRGMWTANYMLRSDYRRGPIALRLLRMLRRSPYQTFIAFGANAAVVPLYRALRAQIVSEIPRYVAILPGAVERMTRLLCLTYPDWPVPRAKALAQAVRLADLPEVSVTSGHTVPARWNDHGWAPWAACTVGAARNLDYLTWRYLEHPCFNYRCMTVPDGDRIGLAVWRLETIRRVTPHGLEEVDRIGRLVEFLPTSRANAKDILSHFWHELDAADVMGADYYGYHSEIGAWLRELGLHRVGEHADGEAMPSRFQPLDGKGGRIMSAIFAQDETPACSLDQPCVWYWTKSDADQDRPN